MSLKAYLDSIGLSHLDVPVENFAADIARMAHLKASLISRYTSSPVVSNNRNSGASVGASCLVTDPRTLMSNGDNFHKTSIVNVESYNVSDLALDGAFTTQLARKRGGPCYHTSSYSASKEQEQLDYVPHLSKKCRVSPDAEDIVNQYIIQNLLQKKGPLIFRDYNQQARGLLQEEQLQRVLQLVAQQQMRYYLQQRDNKHPVPAFRRLDSHICSRRLMQFMYHLQHRPSDNSINYWRKLVKEYYAPGAKKRWCFSLYNGIGERALGVFSHLARAWHCDMCGSKSGKGFDANFELLPRLYETYFGSGILNELLFFDLPHENTLPFGCMSVRYEKVVQETIYQQVRVIREGELRIIFRNDLKILSWEFCAHSHDEVVPRSLIAPQINELVQAAKQYQRIGGSRGVAVQNLQSTCNRFIAAEGQLKRNLDLILVNDLGFPKRYVRCFQIAEIVNSMKDLITFSLDNNIGPIESLAKYSRQKNMATTQMGRATEFPTTAEAVVTVSKQAACGGMSCHQKTLNSTFDLGDKLQQQLIDQILQQMETNTRVKANSSKHMKVKKEVIENFVESPTADVATTDSGENIFANGLDVGEKMVVAERSVFLNGPKMGDCSKSVSGFSFGDYGTNVRVKQEPDIENYYLPEAIKEIDREFFQIGALNAKWNDIGWKG